MASTPGKALARERAQWVKERARAELVRLREAIAEARGRRKTALQRAKETCRQAKERARARAREYRAEQLAKLNREVAEMRRAARNRCQARRHRIRQSGIGAIALRRAELAEERRLQAQMERVSRHALRQRKRSTARERAQEDDDAVRGNLPAELLGVWERVKRHIKGTKRRTRTEAFLEWAEEHPEDVLSYQDDDTEREVRRLVAEHEAAQRQLAKTKPRARRRRASGDEEVPF